MNSARDESIVLESEFIEQDFKYCGSSKNGGGGGATAPPSSALNNENESATNYKNKYFLQ